NQIKALSARWSKYSFFQQFNHAAAIRSGHVLAVSKLTVLYAGCKLLRQLKDIFAAQMSDAPFLDTWSIDKEASAFKRKKLRRCRRVTALSRRTAGVRRLLHRTHQDQVGQRRFARAGRSAEQGRAV